MKLKIPPVVVLSFFVLLMYFVARVFPFGRFVFFGRIYAMYFLLTLAFFIGSISVYQFLKQKTTVDPRKPQKVSSLVTNGLYAFSRNPMYLALLFILLAWCLYLGNAFNYLIAALFVGYMNRFQIFPEEVVLQEMFGKAYVAYCSKVRRWL